MAGTIGFTHRIQVSALFAAFAAAAVLSHSLQAGEESNIPARLAVRPSVPGNLTPISELITGIDNLILSVAASNGAPVAPVCDDATYLRRISLDLTGEIPSYEEIKAFGRNEDPRKRSLYVTELLKRPEYAERWAQFWADVLMSGPGNDIRVNSMLPQLRSYVWKHLRADKGFDELVRQLLVSNEAPAGTYLAAHLSYTDLPKTADNVARNFLGARIGCAQCHDHPFDKWTQQDFWGFASFLAYTSGQYMSVNDVDARLTGERYDPPSAEYVLTARYLDGSLVDVTQPLPPPPKAGVTDEAQTPMMPMRGAGVPSKGRPLDGNTTGEKLRRALATLITERDDLRFDRAIVNRVWCALFGRGLVHPVDDIRTRQNGPHDDILDLLAADFHASGRDLKRLLALLAATQAYQRDSVQVSVKSQAQRDRSVRYFTRADIRPMTPEMLANALSRVARGVTGYASLQRERSQEHQTGRQGTVRAIQDYRTLLAQFRPPVQMFNEAPVPQDQANSFQSALQMMNADFMQRLVQDASNSLRYNAPNDLGSIFLVTLCRMPTPDEIRVLEAQKLKTDALLWVLFNSAEFSSIR